MSQSFSLPVFASPEFRVLERVLIAAEVVVVAWLIATEGPEGIVIPLVVATGAAALGGLISLRWPLGAVSTLIVSSAIPRYAGTLFGLHVRPEHVAIGAVSVALLGAFVLGRLRFFSWNTADVCLLAYVAANFYSSAFASIDPRMTLRWATMNAIVIGPYFLTRLLITKQSRLEQAFRWLLWAGAAEAAFGIFCFLSHRAFGTEFGVSADQYGTVPGTHGSQYEANIFGSYLACCSIMFLALYLFGQKSRRTPSLAAGLALCATGTFVSLARSALGALLVVALLLVLVAAKKGKMKLRQFAVVGGCTAVLLLALSPLIGSFIEERFSSIDVQDISSDSTSFVRLVALGAALDDIPKHPIFGLGTDSLQLTFRMSDYLGHASEMDDMAGWVGNAPVRILHDTGVVGLGFLGAFLIALAVTTVRALRVASETNRMILIALAAGVLVYSITFQATEATLLAFTWVHLGLLAAAIVLVRSSGSGDELARAAGNTR